MPLPDDARTRAISLTVALCLLLSVNTSAQQTRRPEPEQDDEVVRITTELVQTDVAVFDKRGRFVDNLRPEQFELQVGGKTQALSFFERVTAGSRSEAAQLAGAASGRGGAVGDAAAAGRGAETETSGSGRLIFFFIDDLHLSGASLTRAREALLRYVEADLNPGDQAAVVSASGQVGFLQQLTDNPSVLRAAVKRLGYRQDKEAYAGKTQISEYMASQVLDSGNRELYAYLLESTKIEQQMGPGNRHGDHRAAASYSAAPHLRNRLRQTRAQGQMATADTLAALRSLMLSAGAIPGRKLVFFLSDGFILNERNAGALETLRGVTREAARAGAVVYTMDLRNSHFVGPGSGVDATATGYVDFSARRAGVASGEITATREPLQLIADQTGGRAVFNSDSIEAAVREAVVETADYYLLAWRPDSAEMREARPKVTVKGHPEWRVRLRAATFGLPAAESKAESKAKGDASEEKGKASDGGAKINGAVDGAVDEAKARENELLTALGSLHPRRGLPVALSVGYLDTGEHGTVLQVSMQLARTAFDFDAEGGGRKALVDVAGAALDDRGQFGSFKQLLTVTPDAEDAAAPRPVIWHQQLRLKPGLYQVRVALRERATGRVGSAMQWVEIPDLSKGDLTLSSIFLGERKPETSHAATEAGRPRSLAVDVDHRFARAAVLRFQTYVYNAARAGDAGGRAVQVQAQVLRGQTPLVNTAPSAAPSAADPARLPFWSELSLEQLPPGRYILRVTATDLTTGRTAVERVNFTVE